MKNLFIIFLSLLAMTLFTNCSAAQLEKKAPATINNAFFQNWVGGRPGVKGTLVQIEISPNAKQEIVYDSIYFRGQVQVLKSKINQGKIILSANFRAPLTEDRNIIMDSDSSEEMQNKTKGNLPTIPFELTDNECVISYLIKNKRAYFKLPTLKKEKTLYMQ